MPQGPLDPTSCLLTAARARSPHAKPCSANFHKGQLPAFPAPPQDGPAGAPDTWTVTKLSMALSSLWRILLPSPAPISVPSEGPPAYVSERGHGILFPCHQPWVTVIPRSLLSQSTSVVVPEDTPLPPGTGSRRPTLSKSRLQRDADGTPPTQPRAGGSAGPHHSACSSSFVLLTADYSPCLLHLFRDV